MSQRGNDPRHGWSWEAAAVVLTLMTIVGGLIYGYAQNVARIDEVEQKQKKHEATSDTDRALLQRIDRRTRSIVCTLDPHKCLAETE